MFLEWEHTILFGVEERVSAIKLLNLANYWPFYFGIIAPLAGIYFTIKLNQQFVFFSSLIILIVSIIFYFQIVTITELSFSSSNEFKKLIQDNLSVGFYLFTIPGLIISVITVKESHLINYNFNSVPKNIKTESVSNKIENYEDNTEKNNIETTTKTIKISKTSLIIIAILIFLLGSFLYYFKIYKPNKEKEEIVFKVKSLLKKYKYIDYNGWTAGSVGNVKVLTFDENYGHLINRSVIPDGYYSATTSDQTELHKYSVLVLDSNNIVIKFISNNNSEETYQFKQNTLGQTFLVGQFNFYAYNQSNNEIVNNPADNIFANGFPKSDVANNNSVGNSASVMVDSAAKVIVDTAAIAIVDSSSKESTLLDSEKNDSSLLKNKESGSIDQSFSLNKFSKDFFKNFYTPFGRAENILEQEYNPKNLQLGIIKSISSNNYFKKNGEGDLVPAYIILEIVNGPGQGQKVIVDYSSRSVLEKCKPCLIFLDKMKVGKNIKFSVVSNGNGSDRYFYFTEVQID